MIMYTKPYKENFKSIFRSIVCGTGFNSRKIDSTSQSKMMSLTNYTYTTGSERLGKKQC